jgi:hypothetical protein
MGCKAARKLAPKSSRHVGMQTLVGFPINDLLILRKWKVKTVMNDFHNVTRGICEVEVVSSSSELLVIPQKRQLCTLDSHVASQP